MALELCRSAPKRGQFPELPPGLFVFCSVGLPEIGLRARIPPRWSPRRRASEGDSSRGKVVVVVDESVDIGASTTGRVHRMPPRWSPRRRASEGDSSRGKVVVVVDDSVDLGASRGGIRHRQRTPGLAAPAMPPRSNRPAVGRHAPALSAIAAPIDVEAIDDDVQLLPSSTTRTLPQGRNQPSRNYPVTIVLDEELDAQVGSSGMSDQLEIQLTVNDNRQKCPPNENYENVEGSHNATRKHIMDNPEPQKATLKEPAFTCAICLGHMTEETSTVCGHIFCHACIKAAIQTQKKCPTCWKSLTMKNIHRVYLPTGH